MRILPLALVMLMSTSAFAAVPNCFAPNRHYVQGKFSIGFRVSTSQATIQQSLQEIENAGLIVTGKTLRSTLKLVYLSGRNLQTPRAQAHALEALKYLVANRSVAFVECQPRRTKPVSPGMSGSN